MTGLGSKAPKLPPKQHDQDVLPRPPELPPKADKRMKELLPVPPKNLPLSKPPKCFQKDTENDVSIEPPKLSLPPKFLPNRCKRVIEQDPPPRPPKLLPPPKNEDRRITQPDLPPKSAKSSKSSLNKPSVSAPLKVWYNFVRHGQLQVNLKVYFLCHIVYWKY